MATNDFLPFATNASANVVPQGEYVGDPWRPGGFVAGIAQSAQLNKVWRQGSMAAAGLCTFVVNALVSQDVLDNGDVGRLASQIAQAIIATVQNLLIGSSIGGVGGATPIAGHTLITEAPMDGQLYGRRSGAWSAFIPGGGGPSGAYLPLTGGILYNPGQPDPLTIQTDPGSTCRVHFRMLNTHEWALGPGGAGLLFTLTDITAGLGRLTVDQNGLVTIPASLTTPTAGVTTQLTVGNDSLIADPFIIRGAAGATGYARVAMYQGGTKMWTAGAAPPASGGNPYYGIFDEVHGQLRFQIDGNTGMVAIQQAMVVNTVENPAGGLTVGANLRIQGTTSISPVAAWVGGPGNMQYQLLVDGSNDFALVDATSGVQPPPSRLIVTQAGNVSIPGACTVGGAFTASGLTSNFNMDCGQDLLVNRNLIVYGTCQGGPWTPVSDIRLKRDVEPYERGLDAVRQLVPVSYKYNDLVPVHDSVRDQVHYGLSAQDAIESMPEMVVETQLSDADARPYYGLDPDALTYAIVNAIKELADRVEALER